jgi:hypothetical protein
MATAQGSVAVTRPYWLIANWKACAGEASAAASTAKTANETSRSVIERSSQPIKISRSILNEDAGRKGSRRLIAPPMCPLGHRSMAGSPEWAVCLLPWWRMKISAQGMHRALSFAIIPAYAFVSTIKIRKLGG